MGGEGVDLKFGRAFQLLAGLDEEIDRFFASDPFPLETEEEETTGDLVHRVHVRCQPPTWWSTIVGDAIHNARSALDHLAWGLVELDGGTPSEATSFPIADRETGYGDKLRKTLHGTSRETRESVRALRPWHGGDDQLWLLHRLDIVDKHRLLVPVGAAQTGLIMGVTSTHPGAEGESTVAALEVNAANRIYPLFDGAEVLRITREARIESPFMSFSYGAKVVLVLGDGSPASGEPVRILRQLIEHAATVVEPLVERLRARPSPAVVVPPLVVPPPISIVGAATTVFGVD